MPTISNSLILAELCPRWPRPLRLRRIDTKRDFACNAANAPFALTLNGQHFAEADMTSVVTATASKVTYDLTIAEIGVTLCFCFEANENELVLTLPAVREDGTFRVSQIDLSELTLVAGSAATGDSFLRHAMRQANWRRSWCPGTGTYDQWEDWGPVDGAVPEPGAQRSHFACVWNERLCAAIRCSIRVAPFVTHLSATGAVLPGRAGTFSIAPGNYAYRLRGTPAEPLTIRIALLADYNGDGRVNWADAAAWEGDQVLQANPLYHEALVYKLYLDDPLRSAPLRTLPDCLEIIRQVHRFSGGLKQIVYLVGWQAAGHDTGYPSNGPVNARLGGADALRELISAARSLNCTLSLHANYDDDYASDPEHRPDLLSRGPDGRPLAWFQNRLLDEPVYSLNHTLCVESGYARSRLEKLLTEIPLRETLHVDAHRPYNEVWLGDGTHIDAECEVQRGLVPIQQLNRARGIDLTTEDTDPEKRGIYSWLWILPNWRHQYHTVMCHGRIGGVWRHGLSTPRGSLVQCNEGTALGLSFFRTETEHDSRESMVKHFFLHWMLAQLLQRKKMLSYQIGEWNNGVHATYSDQTWSASDHFTTYGVETWYEGIPIARGSDRFLPWRDDVIYAYSVQGGEQEWTVPPSWAGARLKIVTQLEGGDKPGPDFSLEARTIRFRIPAGVPLRFQRTTDSSSS